MSVCDYFVYLDKFYSFKPFSNKRNLISIWVLFVKHEIKTVGEDPHTLHMTLLEKSSCLGANKDKSLSGANALSTARMIIQ